jgi:hypothetical protein
MSLEVFCDTLAEQLHDALTNVEAVYPMPVLNVQSQTVTVSPAPDWGAWEEASSFCDPEVSFELIMVASSSDFRSSMRWFMARLDELKTAFDADPSVGGTCDGVSVAGWTQPAIVSTGSGDALAVRVRLNPVVIL